LNNNIYTTVWFLESDWFERCDGINISKGINIITLKTLLGPIRFKSHLFI